MNRKSTKKMLALLLAAMMSVSVLAGCNQNEQSETQQSTEETTEQTTEQASEVKHRCRKHRIRKHFPGKKLLPRTQRRLLFRMKAVCLSLTIRQKTVRLL